MSKIDNFIEENKMLRALAQDQPGAFQAVYEDCFRLVTRSIQNMNAELFEAEDIFHSALLVLYEKAKLPEFVLECKISTFLVAVARKKWLKKLESEKRLTQKEQDYALIHADEKADASFSLEDIGLQQMNLEKLHQALEELGPPCKQLITAFYIEEKSMKELAEIYGYTNADNAKTQKHKCLQRLKKIFLK